ncbi:MAG: Flp pilus assembly protein CpaB [Pseudomonadota bacterium]
MKRARILVLFIALAAAGGAAFLSQSLVPQQQPQQIVEVQQQLDAVDILVASKDIGLGQRIKSNNLSWQPWPKSQAGNFITKNKNPSAKQDYNGAVAKSAFISGEPISPKKVVRVNQGGVMAAILNSGMRAVSVEIKERTVAGGFVLPNDYVDVIVTRRTRGDSENTHISNTVLKNIRVLAIGQMIESEKDKNVATGRTVTLELNPRQAELLTLADSMGDLSLSLRSLADVANSFSNDKKTINPFERNTGGAIRLLKYGMPSTAYGVQ